MTKLRHAVQKGGLEICIRTRSYKFNGDIFGLRRGGLRQEDRTIARAAQKPLKRELLIENLSLELLPVILHGQPHRRAQREAPSMGDESGESPGPRVEAGRDKFSHERQRK